MERRKMSQITIKQTLRSVAFESGVASVQRLEERRKALLCLLSLYDVDIGARNRGRVVSGIDQVKRTKKK